LRSYDTFNTIEKGHITIFLHIITVKMQNFGLIREKAGHAVLRSIPVPKLRDDYVLVRTVAIALNPTDWTTLDAVGDAGTIVGCDYAGIVEEVGKAVAKSFKKGDRVAGFGHGGNTRN
jgi:NADPH:quinone reductase-like Zn-dependent oxidoreductase